MRLWLPILCALWFCSIAPLAAQSTGDPQAQAERDKQARLEFERGRKAFDEGDYRGAWGFFHNAYRLSGRAQLLYNIGQTADRLGRDTEALQAFKMYLERLPKADNKRDVENRIRALEERVKDSERVPAPPVPGETPPQPTAAEPEAQPVATPPPAAEPSAPPPPPTAAGPRPTRQGFYLRLGLGLGLRRDGVSGGTAGTVSGFGFAGELAAGGTLFPGFVVGGALYSDLASSPSFKADNGLQADLGSAHLTMLGAMADWYLSPYDSGFHVSAALTFAVIAVDYKNAGVSVGRDASGIGAILGFGYEWPIADEMGLGVLGRLSFASLSDDTRSHGIFAPSIMATLTWY
ncbi:MAG TPA: tetratricopeptide repeat protein [Polyangiales bacterium]|nr:tetratricopeptide repeat protein [Polyangiales bacterium]